MRPRRCAQRGQAAVVVACMGVALVGMLGLSIDGGRALAARVRAEDEAQGAARAGAQALNRNQLRQADGAPLADPGAAASAARAYLASTGDGGEVSVDGDRVHVTVHVTQSTQILGVIGIGSISVSGDGDAHGDPGILGAGS